MFFISKQFNDPVICLKSRLAQADHDAISHLAEECIRKDEITLKLELDYKREDAAQQTGPSPIQDINEFLYFDGSELIGYIGIGSFGGGPMEITGMVHPEYRRLGVFTKLHELVMMECRRRKAQNILLLCDHNSTAGGRFLEKIGAAPHHSEYEMHLAEGADHSADLRSDIRFRKAGNADAEEVARQNAIYFDLGGDKAEEQPSAQSLLLPEEEEKRGMTIYFAELDGAVIGKVHLQLINGEGGIYGLGVLPEYRGKGYGRALLLEAVRRLKADGAKDILLQVEARNARALGLYQSCGFKETSVMDYFELNP